MKKNKLFYSITLGFCLLLISLFDMPIAKALTYGHITGSEVRFRSAPNTSSEIYEYFDKGDYVTVLDTNKVSGPGCDSGWYKTQYGGRTGYICGQYMELTDTIQMSYSRPWTSPKKAIMGGAEFIAKDYISAGQFTSYLKKFNVNPNSSYSLNNHQYMANLAAPCSEAYRSYVSYRDNGLLSYPLHFTIPLFNNMPETTKHPTDSVPKKNSTPVTDQEFEKKLDAEGFPESYKTWLRELHQLHLNWTFSSLKTNQDFHSTVAIQQERGSIQKSSCPQCVNSPEIQTESGWYRANIATVEYYVDPRNFLDIDSILMFEDLSYNEVYTESVVKSVLAGTFMSGNDGVDNLPYSSIFVEAGKTYNVSPVYLASLSRQEVGTKIGTVTSGNRFTYKGLTYEGFYNFYNIGAYSSEENPALAGLVYAAAGALRNGEGIYVGNLSGSSSTVGGNTTPTTPSTSTSPNNQNAVPLATQLAKMNLAQKGEFVVNFNLQTNVGTLKSKISGDVVFKNVRGGVMGNTEIPTTGCTLTYNNTVLKVVVYGDITGDGNINSADLLRMRQYLLGQINLSGEYFESAKIVHNDKVNSADLLRLRQFLLGQQVIYQYA